MNDPIPDLDDHMPAECYDVALGEICHLCGGEPAFARHCPYWRQWEAADTHDSQISFVEGGVQSVEMNRGAEGYAPRLKSDREIVAMCRPDCDVDALTDEQVAAEIEALLHPAVPPRPGRLVPKGEKPTAEQLAPLVAALRAAHPDCH